MKSQVAGGFRFPMNVLHILHADITDICRNDPPIFMMANTQKMNGKLARVGQDSGQSLKLITSNYCISFSNMKYTLRKHGYCK